ncbi:hypothetical protein SDC9_33611 [bioreactor metagenome]|jgi:hypothetical protein|uniref:Uncharacterized protein n=1 Tax=bioreactor metagenome TaxID=1076179 RepID=A0A644V8E4_9ZZZZ
MKVIDTYVYEYDPSALILNIIKNGKPFGGFKGPAAEVQFQRLLETGADITISDMSNSIKNARVRRLRAMWVKQGIDQYRDAILQEYGVSSTADLNLQQLDELIDRFSNKTEVTTHTRTLRSDVMVTLDRLGVYVDNGDWQRVNAFLMQPRIAGKLLYQMSDDELLALNRKLRAMLAKKAEQDTEINRLKLLN